MAGVMEKFIVTSIFMWIAPCLILYAFNNNLFPGSYEMDSYSLTLAKASVNKIVQSDDADSSQSRNKQE
ncbi:unnamed protein product [Rhodiola kirilowii]